MRSELSIEAPGSVRNDIFQELIRPQLIAIDRGSIGVVKSSDGEPLIQISEMKGDWIYHRPGGRIYSLNADGLLSTSDSDGRIRFIEDGTERDIVMGSLKSDLDKYAPRPKKVSTFKHLAQVAFRLTHN